MAWRFADRGWFVNDDLNLRSPSNLAAVEGALSFPNIAFGVHRWFRGGRSTRLHRHRLDGRVADGA
jgi:hypothetical protein